MTDDPDARWSDATYKSLKKPDPYDNTRRAYLKVVASRLQRAEERIAELEADQDEANRLLAVSEVAPVSPDDIALLRDVATTRSEAGSVVGDSDAKLLFALADKLEGK